HRRLMRFVPTLSREHGVNHITQTQQSQSTTMIELLLPLSAPMLPSSRRSTVSSKLPLPLLPLIALLFRSAAAASTGETEILREEQQDEERFHQYLCSSLSAASAWFVLVIVSFVIESQILLVVCDFAVEFRTVFYIFLGRWRAIARPNYYLSRPLRACCFGLYCSHDIVGAMKGACRILACIKSCAATGVLCSIPVMNFKGIFIKPFLATLEINDFRHHLHTSPNWNNLETATTADALATNDSQTDNTDSSPPVATSPVYRLLAAHSAIQLGLRDALLDWFILYSIAYAIVAGLTWENADPNMLVVLWGFSVIISAGIFFVAAGKVPQWLGYYHRSRIQILNDTSTLAKQTISDDSITFSSFRYRVRLAVGTHFLKFYFVLLPFYVGLKLWAYLVSILVGITFGYVYMFVVFKCRQKFRTSRALVALGSASVLYVVSAMIFQKGMYLVNEAWQWNFAHNRGVLFAISFFGWLAFCALFQFVCYVDQRRIWKKMEQSASEEEGDDEEEEDPHLFSEELVPYDMDLSAAGERRDATVGEVGLNEPFLPGGERNSGINHSSGLRSFMPSYRGSSATASIFMYQSGYFDPHAHDIVGDSVRSAEGSVQEGMTSRDVFNTFMMMENSGKNISYCQRLGDRLPFKPFFSIFAMTCKDFCGCCCNGKSRFHRKRTWKKILILIFRTLVIVVNLFAIYVALVACVATIQIKGTKALLPAVHKAVYENMDYEEVCAFDEKGGLIQQFGGREEAHLANYSVAHCGECGYCSNWNDLELQYSTRNNLAEQAQECGLKTMFQGVTALQLCLETDIGWTHECARCWAEDIVCTKKHCMFIYLQSQITNQVGNFKVSEDSITSATCEEAYCEAGPAGYFVPCVGANRRRMNITSDIQRPGAQRCNIVDVHDWEEFFYPKK
ncbi:hypothetical protein ACHAXS_001929, partial [Conticribra weissflogii]